MVTDILSGRGMMAGQKLPSFPEKTAPLGRAKPEMVSLGHVAQRSAAEIDKAAKEFEGVFLSQMLGHLFEGVETDPLFGGGEAEDVYRSMLVEEYGKVMARAGGVGIADYVKREMLSAQQVEG